MQTNIPPHQADSPLTDCKQIQTSLGDRIFCILDIIHHYILHYLQENRGAFAMMRNAKGRIWEGINNLI